MYSPADAELRHGISCLDCTSYARFAVHLLSATETHWMHIGHPVTCSFPDAQSIVAVSPTQCAEESESSDLQGVFLGRLLSPLPWFSITAGREGHGCVGEATVSRARGECQDVCGPQ